MCDYIDREEAINTVCEGCNDQYEDEPCEPSCCSIRERLQTIPAADVAEVRHGEWIKNESASAKHVEPIFYCSSCRNMEAWGAAERDEYNYCPNCGAKMDGGADSG